MSTFFGLLGRDVKDNPGLTQINYSDPEHAALGKCIISVKEDVNKLLIWNELWKWLIPLLVGLNLINIAL